jgi:hypothetical protein
LDVEKNSDDDGECERDLLSSVHENVETSVLLWPRKSSNRYL